MFGFVGTLHPSENILSQWPRSASYECNIGLAACLHTQSTSWTNSYPAGRLFDGFSQVSNRATDLAVTFNCHSVGEWYYPSSTSETDVKSSSSILLRTSSLGALWGVILKLSSTLFLSWFSTSTNIRKLVVYSSISSKYLMLWLHAEFVWLEFRRSHFSYLAGNLLFVFSIGYETVWRPTHFKEIYFILIWLVLTYVVNSYQLCRHLICEAPLNTIAKFTMG